MHCDECNGETEAYQNPDYRLLFRIPFSRWHLALWTWRGELQCLECTQASADRQARAIYDAGAEDAMEKFYGGYRE